MTSTACPVPGCGFTIAWNISDLPAVNPLITDGDTAIDEAAARAAALEADRVEAALLEHGETAHDIDEFVAAVLAHQAGSTT